MGRQVQATPAPVGTHPTTPLVQLAKFPYEWSLTNGMGARQAVACGRTRPPRCTRPTRETPTGSSRPPRIVPEQCVCRISAAAVLDLLRPWRGCGVTAFSEAKAMQPISRRVRRCYPSDHARPTAAACRSVVTTLRLSRISTPQRGASRYAVRQAHLFLKCISTIFIGLFVNRYAFGQTM